MPEPVVVLADDLTGAADSSSAWAVRGHSVVLVLPGATPPGDVDVVAMDLDLRHADDDRAADEIARALAHCAGPAYLKLDSVLRGPVEGLVDGVRRARPDAHLVVCPAFPAQGRRVIGGQVLVDGKRIATTHRLSSHPGVVCADASDDDDLDGLASSLDGTRVIGAGSGGLSRAWARRWPDRSREGAARPAATPVCEEVVVVAGTDHPVTEAQLEHLGQALPRCTVLRVHLGRERPILPASVTTGARVGLVLTGGDTARAVLAVLGCTSLDVTAEVAPGIPAMRLRDGRAAGLPVVVKSGGFGEPDALAEAVAWLLGDRRGSRA